MKTIVVYAPRNYDGTPKHEDSIAFVDDEDYEELSKYRWRYLDGYSCAFIPEYGQVLMHRFIMGFPERLTVDHIDRNKLNNQKTNLRICTQNENGRNTRRKGTHRTYSDGRTVAYTSQYKGVFRMGKKWQVQIKINHKSHYIGIFKDEEEAARAYDKAARELHGEFAALNFPNDPAPSHSITGPGVPS